MVRNAVCRTVLLQEQADYDYGMQTGQRDDVVTTDTRRKAKTKLAVQSKTRRSCKRSNRRYGHQRSYIYSRKSNNIQI